MLPTKRGENMEELRESLINLINSSQLPLDAKYYVLKDVFREVDKVYYDELKKLKEKEVSENE